MDNIDGSLNSTKRTKRENCGGVHRDRPGVMFPVRAAAEAIIPTAGSRQKGGKPSRIDARQKGIPTIKTGAALRSTAAVMRWHADDEQALASADDLAQQALQAERRML